MPSFKVAVVAAALLVVCVVVNVGAVPAARHAQSRLHARTSTHTHTQQRVAQGEDGAVVPGHASYWYPRSGFGYGWPTHAAAGELPLSHLCKAIVDIFAPSAANVANAMAGVAVTTTGQIVLALSGTLDNPGRTYDDNDLANFATEFRKLPALVQNFPGFSANDIINLNAPNRPLHHLGQLLEAVGTNMGVPGYAHHDANTCPTTTRHTVYPAYAHGLNANTLAWSVRAANAPGDFLTRVGSGTGWKFGTCAGTKLAAFAALSGLQYTCMAERKTTQGGYRASCLTCQKVIPELHHVDVQVQRWRGYVTTACQNIGTLALDAAQNARAQAHTEYTQALTTLQQRRTQVDTAQRNVDQRLQNEHVIPGATESKQLTALRKLLTTATTNLNTATTTARTREDAYRVAQLRVELLGNVAGAVATCQSWTSAVQFALY